MGNPPETLWVSGGQGLISWGVGKNGMSLFAQIYAEIRDVTSNMSCSLLLGLAINSKFLYLVQEADLIVRWYLEKSKDKFLHGVCSGTIGQQTFKLLRLALKSSKDFTGQHFEMLVFPLDIQYIQLQMSTRLLS